MQCFQPASALCNCIVHKPNCILLQITYRQHFAAWLFSAGRIAMCNALSTALYLCFVMIIDHSVPNSNTNDTLHSNCKHFLLLTTLILPTDYLHLTFHTTAKFIWSVRQNKPAWIQVLSTIHIATIILPLSYCHYHIATTILPLSNCHYHIFHYPYCQTKTHWPVWILTPSKLSHTPSICYLIETNHGHWTSCFFSVQKSQMSWSHFCHLLWSYLLYCSSAGWTLPLPLYVFVRIAKCNCSNCKMYSFKYQICLFKLQNIFDQISASWTSHIWYIRV